MAPRIDMRAMLVRDGDIALPFATDCGAGTAVLDPLGQPLALRTMRWGEKCRLARHADAEPAFLEAQFVAICSEGIFLDADRRHAATALALWLHGTVGPPLPLDAKLLGEVTLGLCRTLAIGPAELANMAVPEVEALWLALHGVDTVSATATADAVSEGFTRIIVEPDPPVAPARQSLETASPNQSAVYDSSEVTSPVLPAASNREAAAVSSQAAAHATEGNPTTEIAAWPVRHPVAGEAGPRQRARTTRIGRAYHTPASRFRFEAVTGRPGEVTSTIAEPLHSDIPSQGSAGPGTSPVRGMRADASAPSAPAAPVSTGPVAADAIRHAGVLPASPGAPVAAAAGQESTGTLLDARLGTLIDIVTRAALPRDAASDPDAAVDSFSDRFAEAVAELGLAGGE